MLINPNFILILVNIDGNNQSESWISSICPVINFTPSPNMIVAFINQIICYYEEPIISKKNYEDMIKYNEESIQN